MTLADLPDTHDLAHLGAALSYVTDHRRAIDGGAHRGIWTAVLSDYFSAVEAFEPVSSNRERIPRLHNVTVRGFALHRESGNVPMVPGAQNTGQWHVAAPGESEVDSALCVPLDAYRFEGVGFLKLDVEGMEAHALMGARGTIRRCRPVVLIEENGLCRRYGVRDNAAGRLLGRWGYRLRERLNKDYIYTPEEAA